MFLVLVNQFFHIKNGKFYHFTTIFLTAVSLQNKKLRIIISGVLSKGRGRCLLAGNRAIRNILNLYCLCGVCSSRVANKKHSVYFVLL